VLLKPLLWQRFFYDIYCMKRIVATFEEFIGDLETRKLKRLVGREEEEEGDELTLDPDTQNPTYYGDDEETATAAYPFGGI